MPTAVSPQNERESRLGMLYRMHRNAMLRFLARKVGTQEAPDLMQETFLRYARADLKGVPVQNEKAFLFQVAANLAADHGRAGKRKDRLLTPGEVDALLHVPDETPGPKRIAETRAELQCLVRALAELPPRRVEAFRLSRVEGMSHAEIALRLGVSLRTVEAEVRMALDHCAERLQVHRSSD